MKKRMLLTSFDTWLPHQKSNSSDDLLSELAQLDLMLYDLTYIRRLPVDVQLASSQVIERICDVQPEIIICCGMAEKRQHLNIESCASLGESVLQTTIDLEQLVLGSAIVKISHDCGKFVCEGFYYLLLDYLQQHKPSVPCLFVHVPILTEDNLPVIVTDFLLIIHRLAFW